jgi:hypothetical protein
MLSWRDVDFDDRSSNHSNSLGQIIIAHVLSIYCAKLSSLTVCSR